jgi:hypothetical protein
MYCVFYCLPLVTVYSIRVNKTLREKCVVTNISIQNIFNFPTSTFKPFFNYVQYIEQGSKVKKDTFSDSNNVLIQDIFNSPRSPSSYLLLLIVSLI